MRKSCFLFLLPLICATLLVADDAAKETKEGKEVKVTGSVEAVYNDDGDVIDVTLWDWRSDAEYTLAKNAKKEELKGHVDKDVTVTGKVAETDDGLVLTVVSFEVAKKAKVAEPQDGEDNL